MKTTKQTTTVSKRPVHPAAHLIPEPTPEEYERLKADIKQHGLKVPIVLTPDGQILDGRTRSRIVDELRAEGLIPRVVSRVATVEEMLDPVALVLSLNAARRHLTADQIAAIYLSRPIVEPPEEALSRVIEEVECGVEGYKKDSEVEPLPKAKRGKKGEGKVAGKIGKKIGVSRATVERVQEIQKKAPEKMADIVAGKISAKKVLKVVNKDVVPRKPDLETGRSMISWRAEGLLATTKAFTREIKDTVKKHEPVTPEEYDSIKTSLDKLRVALDTVAPRWQCEECEHVLDDEDGEPEPIYECGECGEQMKGQDANRCESCNKFAAKVCDEGCPEEECYGEMVQVGWETVSDQVAKQEKQAQDKRAARMKKQKEEEAFDKTPAGKKKIAWKEEEEDAEDRRRAEEHEDNVLEHAASITEKRNAPLTPKEQKAKEQRAVEVGKIIERALEARRAPLPMTDDQMLAYHQIKCFTTAEAKRYSEALGEAVEKEYEQAPQP